MLFNRYCTVFGYQFLDKKNFLNLHSGSPILSSGEAIEAKVPKAETLNANCIDAPELAECQAFYAATHVYRLQKAAFPQLKILSTGGILLDKKRLLSTGLSPNNASIAAALYFDNRPSRNEKFIIAPFPHDWSCRGTYGDYIVRILPRICRVLELVEPAHRNDAVITYCLFNKPYEIEFLSHLGFSKDRIIDARRIRVECKNDGVVYCPDGEDSSWAIRSAHPNDYQAVRRAFCSGAPQTNTRRLYLKRGLAQLRSQEYG